MKVSEPAVAYNTSTLQGLKNRLITAIDNSRDEGRLQTCLRVLEYTQDRALYRESRELVVKLEDRAIQLSQLKPGWDGKDSVAIDKKVLSRFSSTLVRLTDRDLVNWALFPDARGYLYLDFTADDNMAGITLLPDSCVYFVKKSNDIMRKGSFDFTPQKLSDFIKKTAFDE